MLTFANSWAFLLLPVPFLIRWLLPAWSRPRPAVRLPGFQQLTEHLDLKAESGASIRRRSRVQALLFVLAWVLAVTALARPQWLEPPVVREVPTRDLLLAVDLSGSMEAEDFTATGDGKIGRLDAVKQVLDDFLKRREGDRVGLVVFGNAAFVQAPFTQDLNVVRQLLHETAVRMAGPKTAFGDAIGLGITLFERSKLEQRVMIALTDGNDTGSDVPPADAADIAAEKGIVIHTVAIGDPGSVGEEALDEAALQAVAAATGGNYYFAQDRESLEGVYETLDKLESRKVETMSYRPRRDLFHWSLGIALLLVLAYHLLMAWRTTLRLRSARLHNPEMSR
ncbi:MAG: VWA domain-containing protein [Pseudomonadota bacterium]